MPERIKTYEEWNGKTIHGSYDDYVKHIQDYNRREQEASEERIAQKVVEKLTGKK